MLTTNFSKTALKNVQLLYRGNPYYDLRTKPMKRGKKMNHTF